MNDVESHIDFLFEGLEGFVYVPTKSPGTFKQNFFHYPDEREALIEFVVSSSESAEVYMAPAIFKEKSATKSSVQASQVVWIDYDNSSPVDFKGLPEPDRIVQSSLETHIHAYWRVGVYEPEQIETCNRNLAHFLGADMSGWDVSQILRPPGTINHKRSLPVVLHLASESWTDISEFDSLPEIYVPKVGVTPTTDLPDYKSLIGKLSPKLLRLIEDKNGKEKDRSNYLFKLGCELAEKGIEKLGAISVIFYVDDRIGKFKGRSDRFDQIARLVEIAYAKVTPPIRTLNLRSPSKVLELGTNTDWVLPGLLPVAGLMIVTGAPNVGKTQWCLQQTREFCKFKTIFLELETSQKQVNRIIHAQSKAVPVDPLFEQNVLFDAPDEVSQDELEQVLLENATELLIIDSLSEMCNVDDKEETWRFMRWLNTLTSTTQTAIIFVHHNRKPNGDNKKANKLGDLYGSQYIAAKSDTIICLWETTEKNKLEVLTLKNRDGPKEDWNLWKDPKTLTFSKTQPGASNANSGTSETKPTGGNSINLSFG
jgi:hypothetical protein